jgi:hypothetical protein
MKGIGRWVGLAALALAGVWATAAVGAVNGTTHKVTGTLTLEGVGCGPAGACLAVGQTPRNSQNESTGAFVVIKNGKPGSAHKVAGTNDMNRVFCPKKNYCIAVGSVFSAHQHAVFVVINHGVAGKVRDLGMSEADSIGCGSTSSCWVPGAEFPTGGARFSTPMLVHLAGPKVAKTYTLSGPYAFFAGEGGGATPFCPTASSCVMVGGDQQKGEGVIFSMRRGKVKVRHRVPGTTSLSGLFCTSASFCRIVGFKAQGESEQGAVLTMDSHGVGKVHSVSVATFPLACVDKGSCFTFGAEFKNNKVSDFVVPINGGRPGTPQKIGSFVSNATCRGSRCLGVGQVGSFPNETGTVFTFTG